MARGLIVCMPFENHVSGRVSLKETGGNGEPSSGVCRLYPYVGDFRRCICPGIERFRMGMNVSGNFDFVERFFFFFFFCEIVRGRIIIVFFFS